MNTDLITYYKDRAKEYENIYLKPERQEEINKVSTILQDIFSGKNVFEIACGTGYWTEKIAQTACSVFATDINESVIDVAKQKNYNNANVTFGIEDIFEIRGTKKHENLFGGFIWSHVPLQDLTALLQTINSLVLPGGTVAFLDNNYVEGSSLPITKTDEHGNTYQSRKLENGSEHLVLKNFPTETSLRNQLEIYIQNIQFIKLKYYWIVSYTTKANGGN